MKKLLNKKNLYPIGIGVLLIFFSYIIRLNPAILFSLIVIYLCFKKRFSDIRSANLLNLGLLYLISFVIGYSLLKNGMSIYYVPIAIISMLSVLLFNNLEIAYFLSLTTSLSLAILAPEPFKAWFIFITSCAVAILIVGGARKRTRVIQAGFIAGVAQLAALILLESFFNYQYPQRYLIILINGLVCGMITLGILPLFEYLFRTVTNISLLELADSNQPILQRMILEAPGTYHHSLIVGNLADAACSAIGANGLLARVGAYYHDIGKLQKPEYFIENQNIKANAHDDLSPTMSKLIIMNHIKEGLELAKKYHLSPILWNFIQQHHGNSLVYYFYRRALEEGKEDNQEVSEEGFRYPGPKPNTIETAIVLLADSVEAATRSLKGPNPDRIVEMVHKIINNKFIDGQLDECELTLKDIEKISSTFNKILSGIYHSRIDYPQEPRDEPRHH
ncbi:MAG: hypothetical protein COV71_01855 [Candidatus Omnitrophica bacterium CG11_big_fil_rev_8_21_14_0_20_41_12]|nr:MAG: hypothetical protein COV71_01855 [Candidatus Omnitrophica bacterium CG11_big_fil_rev_8_21_14_0_20_41_12]